MFPSKASVLSSIFTHELKRPHSYVLLDFADNARRPADCTHLICSGSDDLITTLSEICQNLLEGNIPLSGKQLESLRESADVLRVVCKKATSIKRKRSVLVQKGVFLILALIGMALPLIKSILRI